MLHLVPFHRSARVPEFENPTLVQAEDEAQETALKVPPPAAGLGDGTMRHVTPFHRSARVLALGVKGLEAPTARHADGPVQATPIRAAPWAPGGFGVGWMCHTRPFHRSATVVPILEGPKETPVVVQAEGDVQDTGPMMTPSALRATGWAGSSRSGRSSAPRAASDWVC